MSSTNSSQTCPTMNRLRKSAISYIAVEILVLKFPHLIHDEDGFWERLQLENLVEVAAWLTQCEISFSLESFVFLFREMVRAILFCQFVHLYALLLGPEYLCNVHLESQLFCSISSTRYRLYGTLSVLRFCHVEHHGNALSWSRSAG